MTKGLIAVIIILIYTTVNSYCQGNFSLKRLSMALEMPSNILEDIRIR